MRLDLPDSATGLRLARITSREELILCEPVIFVRRSVVDMVLRRAAISGRVEVNGEICDHFADVLDSDGDGRKMESPSPPQGAQDE